MNERNFSTAFTVEQTPKEVYAAIGNVRAWWSADIAGRSERIGDVFTFQYRDIHRSEQKVMELNPGKKIVWLVLDAELTFTRARSEWQGTKIAFEISRKDKKTELRFTHIGLVPENECFDECADAWSFYIRQSLRKLIVTGRGEPCGKQQASLADATW